MTAERRRACRECAAAAAARTGAQRAAATAATAATRAVYAHRGALQLEARAVAEQAPQALHQLNSAGPKNKIKTK